VQKSVWPCSRSAINRALFAKFCTSSATVLIANHTPVELAATARDAVDVNRDSLLLFPQNIA
jgi:hypothetical protein